MDALDMDMAYQAVEDREEQYALHIEALEGKINLLEIALLYIRPKMFEAQEMMRTNNFVIDNLDDRWQKLAFTLYNYLVDIYVRADAALGGG